MLAASDLLSNAAAIMTLPAVIRAMPLSSNNFHPASHFSKRVIRVFQWELRSGWGFSKSYAAVDKSSDAPLGSQTPFWFIPHTA